MNKEILDQITSANKEFNKNLDELFKLINEHLEFIKKNVNPKFWWMFNVETQDFRENNTCMLYFRDEQNTYDYIPLNINDISNSIQINDKVTIKFVGIKDLIKFCDGLSNTFHNGLNKLKICNEGTIESIGKMETYNIPKLSSDNE